MCAVWQGSRADSRHLPYNSEHLHVRLQAGSSGQRSRGVEAKERARLQTGPEGELTMQTFCNLAMTFILMQAFCNAPATQTAPGRKFRQEDEEAKVLPYLGRVDPVELCELIKCRKPAGAWCQVVEENCVKIPKCLCPQTCSRADDAPVCSVTGKSYASQCLLHKEACRKRRRIGLAHQGRCTVLETVCSAEEFDQFPYRLMDWFLHLRQISTNVTFSHIGAQICMCREDRRELAKGRFLTADRNKNGKLGQRELKKLQYKHLPMEHCAKPFFQTCDTDRNKKVTLEEWLYCLVDRSEIWYEEFMSVKMGSSKICQHEGNQ
ncbi:SPARC-like [Ambystoma mexicanum]|uniref:SPARC-like n=1 Tax=Ambystoma mexicanum TaxID=8296 RepID=UPI0037E7552D